MNAKRGGQGSKANTAASKQHDAVVKSTALAISAAIAERNIPGLFLEKTGHNKKNRIPEMLAIKQGCVPDGYMWFSGNRNDKNRVLVAAFEAKKQGTTGNAIERWFKNALFCLSFFKDAKYVSFLTGPGAASGEILDKHASDAMLVFNNLGITGVRFVKQVNAFTHQQVFNEMKQALGLSSLSFKDIKPYIK
jgi:hypothetical protein